MTRHTTARGRRAQPRRLRHRRHPRQPGQPWRLPPLAAALVLLAALVVPVHLSVVPSLAAPAVTVNSTDDDPDVTPGDGVCTTGQLNADGVAECTLRAAIQEANASVVDEITFAVPTTDSGNTGGIVTIAPAAALPAITAAALVDARTQTGWTALPVVVLDGSATSAGPGLEVTVGPSLVAGLAVHSFAADGIELRGTTDTTVRDNHVGVDETGLVAPGNGGAGIRVDAGTGNAVLDNTVGGNAGHGVVVDQGPDVIVRGNRIGVGSDGVTALGNGDAGIEVVVPTSSAIRIGGTAVGEGNHIAHNVAQGVGLGTSGLSGVSILGNSIHGNGGLGIDLGDDGVTANDAGDADAGPNDNLNTPVPSLASDVAVVFDLDVPAGDYRIEVFRNPTEGADPLGSGEGEQLVGGTTVTHAGTGVASFTVSGLTGAQPGDVLSLTTTEDLGGGSHGSTSEFSPTITADDHVVTVNDGGDTPDASPGDGTCDTGALNAAGDPACTLRAALQEANATAVVDTVAFAVPAADAANVGGVVTLAPATALPTITAALTLDGTTQPAFAGDPVVAVDGTALAGDLLTLAGDGATVRSLALHGAGGHGLFVTAGGANIADTWVGLLPDGTTVDGVGGDGIRVDGALGVHIHGGRVTGSGGDGVTVLGAAADVAVVDTLVSGNTGIGIDLGADGVTANDVGDGDSGPNGLYNRPVVTSASEAGGTVSLGVALDTAAGAVLLQVFTTPRPDPSGAGEGEALVHSETVTHPGGAATHTLAFAGDLTQTFTVTATEDLGGGAYGATSEFSASATRPVAAGDPGDVASEVAARAPLSWWRLGEAAGTTAADSGSLGNIASHTGGPTPGVTGALTGDGDTATAYDGTDDVTVAPHDASYLLDEGTVSLWVAPDDLATTGVPFSKESAGLDTGGHTDLRIEPDGTVVHRLASTTGEVEVASAPGAVGTGAWHHLAITFGPRGMELWVDGARVGTDPYTGGWGTTSGGAGNSEPITIGASGATSGDGAATPASSFLDGSIDEVAVFGTQLDGAAIAAIAGAAGQHYEVDGGQSLTVPAAGGVVANDHDADGEALTATLVSGPAAASAFSLAPDGSFTHTSTPGFVGIDTFTYTATDGALVSAPATVSITVLPALGDRVIDDSTGNGHAGRAGGGMTSGDQVAGRIGGALDLDGSDDRVVVNNLDVAGDQLTLSAWVDPDTVGADPVVLAKAVGLADADVQWRLLLADTSATTANAAGSVRTGAGLVDAVDPGATDTAGGWVHLVVRYDGSQVVLFVDGVAVATAAHSGPLQPDPSVDAAIGAFPSGGSPFDGRIDEVTVSQTAHSDAWIAAAHATQDQPGAAVTVGAVQTSASSGWTTDSSQARSGSSAALAPSGVLRSWLTLDGIVEGGLEAVSWWRVNALSGLDAGQGVRAGDAAGTGPVRQDEAGLFGPSGWDLGQVDGARTQLVAPPAGQSPAVDAWQRVTVRIDQGGALSATAAGTDVPTSGTTPGGVAPTGTVGFRVGPLDPTTRWWIDDLRVRRYVTPEPVASLRRTELAP